MSKPGSGPSNLAPLQSPRVIDDAVLAYAVSFAPRLPFVAGEPWMIGPKSTSTARFQEQQKMLPKHRLDSAITPCSHRPLVSPNSFTMELSPRNSCGRHSRLPRTRPGWKLLKCMTRCVAHSRPEQAPPATCRTLWSTARLAPPARPVPCIARPPNATKIAKIGSARRRVSGTPLGRWRAPGSAT